MLSLIKHRYELDSRQGSQFFRTANNIGPQAWDTLKFNLARKILTPNSTFLMIFGGSSVTAGHDSYYNQSYPYIFKKRMGSIFQALGLKLSVHNIAQGANNCIPYSYCYESMGGADADFLGWEQSYNCGRDNGVFELMARLSLWSRAPALLYFSASGAWSPTSCPPAEDPVPYCSEDWHPSLANLPAWQPTESDIQSERDVIFKFHARTPSSQRFSQPYRNDYPYAAVHGFNVWENNGECVAEKNGRNATCNGLDAVEGCAMKFMRKEASLYGQPSGKGAGWHPTRAFHMLRGEALAWLYGLVLFDAVFMLQQDLLSNEPTHLLRDYNDKLSMLRGNYTAPGHPKYCASY
ncbi:hypothetical protein EON64_20250, partial [archaeon]